MPKSHPDGEDAWIDGSNRATLLVEDDTTDMKTRRLQSVTIGGKNYLLGTSILMLADGTLVDASNPIPVDTEISVSGDVIVQDVDINDISAGTQTNDVKVTLDSEVVSVADDKASSANADTAVTVGNTSTSVLASNANRKKAIIVNDSNETVYLSYSGTAAMNSGIRLNANGGAVDESTYTGAITAICTSGSKVVTVTEL